MKTTQSSGTQPDHQTVAGTFEFKTNGKAIAIGFTEQQLSPHALIQILSGECEFSLDGKPHHLKSGDLLYLPPNLPHAVRATTQFSMLLTLTKPAAVENSDHSSAKTKII